MKNKTVFVTAFHSFISKNILNTDAFSGMVQEPNVHIVLLVPEPKKDFFAKVYTSDGVTVVGVLTNAFANRKSSRFFSKLAYLLIDSHYLWYKKVERLDKNKTLKSYLRYWFDIVFTKLFAGRQWARKVMRSLFMKFSIPEIKSLFEKHKPDLLFSTDIFDEGDVLIMREAKRAGVRITGMIRSWDNCYSKGVLRVLPDSLITNNETLKEEAVIEHDIPAHVITPVGLPQFDAFMTAKRMSREDFMKSIGADPAKALIVLAPAGSILSDTDWQICEIIQKAINENKFGIQAQVLVRNHPHHPADLSKFVGDKNFIIENPGRNVGSANPKDAELTKSDSDHLADTLYHCAVIIFTATTLGLDALVYNKPQIVIDFDGYENKPYTHSVRRYHNEDHMKKMISCKGVTVAESADELVKAIAEYLKNPAKDQAGRDKMLVQQLYKLDAQAGKRVANHVLNDLHKV